MYSYSACIFTLLLTDEGFNAADEEKDVFIEGAFEPQLDQLDQLFAGFEIDERLIICIARLGIVWVKRGFVEEMA